MRRAQDLRPDPSAQPGLSASRPLLLAVSVVVALLVGLTAGPAQAQTRSASSVDAADAAWAQALAPSGTGGTLAVVVAPVQSARASLADRTPAPVGNAAADRPTYSASLVKLLVVEDVLHRARTGALTLTTADRQLLMSMLITSDDPAMNTAWERWGADQMVRDAAARYGLTSTAPPAELGQWGQTVTTAGDMARFLAALPVTAHPEDATTMRFWLSMATPLGADGFDQSFGLLAQDTPGTAAKQGWMCCVADTRHLHSVGYVDDTVVVLLGEVPAATGWDVAIAGLDAAAAALLR